MRLEPLYQLDSGGVPDFDTTDLAYEDLKSKIEMKDLVGISTATDAAR